MITFEAEFDLKTKSENTKKVIDKVDSFCKESSEMRNLSCSNCTANSLIVLN